MRTGSRIFATAVAACRGIGRGIFACDAGAPGPAVPPFIPGVSTEDDIVRHFGRPASLALLANGQRYLSYTGMRSPGEGTFIPIVGAFCHPAGQGISTVVLQISEHGVLERWIDRP